MAGCFFTYDTYIPNVIIMLANSIKTIGKYSNQVLGTYFLPTKVSLKYVELDKGAEFPIMLKTIFTMYIRMPCPSMGPK